LHFNLSIFKKLGQTSWELMQFTLNI